MRITRSPKIKSRIAVTPKGLKPSAQGCEPRATLGKPAANPHNPVGVASISDADYDEIVHLVSASIHELVFAEHHIDDNQLDHARKCLLQVQMNADRLHAIVNDAMPEEAA